jgi:membrane associated rhomboid family serine protease
MTNKSEIKYEIVNSDILKIFVLVFSFFTLLGVVRLYYMFNGDTEQQLVQWLYPWITVTSNTVNNLTRPWVWFTHIGAELSVMSMITNFLWLYMFGFVIQDLKGKNSIWPLFIFAAVICALVVVLCVAVKPNALSSGFYFGMRAGIVAVAAAACFFRPTYKVFQMFNGGFSLWILGVIFVVLSLSMGHIDLANIAAILTAVFIGYLYNNQLKNFFDNMQNRITKNAESKLPTYAKPKKPKYNDASVMRGAARVVDISEHKMNALLDKISANGMESLTEVEKQWLEAYSSKNKLN